MNYSLFYNYRALGDVLIIVINPFLDATSYKKEGDVCVIFHDEEIIGYNIFNISRIIKIHYQGLIVSPIRPLIDVINNVLKNHHLPLINEQPCESFIVGKVVDIKNDIYKVDIKNEIISLKSYQKLNVGDLLIVIKPNVIMPNAKITTDYTLASKAMLMLDESDEILILDDDKLIGSDFYLGEVKWSN